MDLTVEQLAQMTADIALGLPREQSKVYQPEHAALWDQIESEVSEAKASGLVIDVPYDPVPTNQGVALYGDEEALQ